MIDDFKTDGPLSQISAQLAKHDKILREMQARQSAFFTQASPITTNMLTHYPDSIIQGTWERVQNSSYLYNGTFVNTSGDDNDSFAITVFLPAGTYTLRFNAAKAPNRGIVKVEIETTNLGNTDLYAAVSDFLNVVEYSGVAITTSKMYAVTFTINGKNVASSDHVIDVSEIEFIRTA